MSVKKPMEDIPIEEDVPRNCDQQGEFSIDDENTTQSFKEAKEAVNVIQGHRLLMVCVASLFIIYVFELFCHKGSVSAIADKIIEIVKLLIFSLTGYLFGTHYDKNS